MSWTKELPKEEGMFWYRSGPNDPCPTVVEWNHGNCWMWKVGADIMYVTPDQAASENSLFLVEGEFWSEKLVAPPAQPYDIGAL